MAAYAGDMSSAQAWQVLSDDKDAVLIDVRSRAEWTFVGLPDMSSLGREVVLAEWQRFPDMSVDPGFADDLAARLEAAGVTADTRLLFLCRSGGRSQSAAIAMTERGYGACFNIADGFEGGLDPERHRGRVAGWKAAGLPWLQS